EVDKHDEVLRPPGLAPLRLERTGPQLAPIAALDQGSLSEVLVEDRPVAERRELRPDERKVEVGAVELVLLAEGGAVRDRQHEPRAGPRQPAQAREAVVELVEVLQPLEADDHVEARGLRPAE